MALPVAALLLACTIGLPASGWAQGNSATFQGRVADPSDAVVSGAQVTLTNQSTQTKLTKVTNEAGDFAFTFVPVGVYDLRIDVPGFKSYAASGISLRAGDQVRQNLTLEIGSTTEVVKVEAETSAVNTVSAQQLRNYSLTDVRELPLQNRNFTGLLKINAGVVPSTGNDGTGINLNGVGRNGTVYSVDGTNASGNVGSNNPGAYQGGNLVDVMSVEGIEDVSVVKGVIAAEFPNAIGGQVNVVSRSGTNNWHGSLFSNHQNSAMAARFQPSAIRPRLTFNQFGGSLGGPIVRNKVFVFGDYEGYRYSESSFVQGNVPVASLRSQLIAAVPDYKLVLDQFPLPSEPVAPGANVGLFRTTRAAERRDNHFDVKGDVHLTSTSRISVTYNRGTPTRTIARYFVDDPRLYFNSLNRGNVGYTTSGTSWTSESRFGYNRTIQDRIDNFFNNIAPGGSEQILYGRRIPRISTTLGFSGPDGEINHSGGTMWEFSEKYARQIGRHAVKLGGHYRRTTGTRNNPEIPSFFFSSLENLLQNKPNDVTATLGSGIYDGRMSEFGFFVQDDWNVARKLTLNLGLRYDYYSNFAAFGKGGTPDAGLYNPEFLSMDGQFNVGKFRDRSKPYDSDPLNFAPRFGFAYNPDGKGKTSIRGGFGVMFSNIVPEDFWNLVSSAPNLPYRVTFSAADISRFNIRYPDYNDNFFKYANQLIATTPITNVAGIYNTKLQSPYTMQYTLDIQREIAPGLVLQSAFVGTRGVKFISFRFANTVDRITGLRPNPNLQQPYYVDNSQSSTYYGWQNSINKRFSRGLSFNANYTWSKALANGGGDTGAYYDGENGTRNQSFFDLRADRGPTASDLTHYFSGSVLYQLPALSGRNAALRHVVGGWQISTILRAQSGYAAMVTQSSSTPAQRADYIGGEAILPNYRDTLQYLNPEAFARIPVSSASGAPIRPGNAGTGVVRGPGMWNADLSIGKNFSLRENMRLQIRTDMFNALNHTNLSGLRTSINDPRFGQLLSTLGARVVQLNARITF